MPNFSYEIISYTSDSGAVFQMSVSPAIKALITGANSTGLTPKTPQITIRGELPNPRGYRGRRIGGSVTAPDSIFVPIPTLAAWNLLKRGTTVSYKGGTYKIKPVAEKSNR